MVEVDPLRNCDATFAGREAGHRVRESMLCYLKSDAVVAAIEDAVNGMHVRLLPKFLEDQWLHGLEHDLHIDPGWGREHWVLREDQSVAAVTEAEFQVAIGPARFSKNDCLRKPDPASYAVRGFLSAITDRTVAECWSTHLRTKLKFRSVDIAKYGEGDYLRRHSDTFEDRLFGIVWFIGQGWRPGSGGELLVENDKGESDVIQPISGAAAVLSFKADYYHQVAANRSANWRRLAMATHFALTNHS